MASIYDLKPRFQALLRPVMRLLAQLGVTPNGLTLAAIAGSVGIGAWLASGACPRAALISLPAWLFVRMALNALDGMMARELEMSTDMGAVLNEVGDVVSDVALYLPLAVALPDSLWAGVAFAIGAALTEFCGVTGAALGASRSYAGPMGKSDRAFVAGTLALVVGVWPDAGVAAPWVLWAGAALAAVTCVNRLRVALAELGAAHE